MNQQSLEDLLAFIELRNITLAAQRRNISQPAYSRRLKALEESANKKKNQKIKKLPSEIELPQHFSIQTKKIAWNI